MLGDPPGPGSPLLLDDSQQPAASSRPRSDDMIKDDEDTAGNRGNLNAAAAVTPAAQPRWLRALNVLSYLLAASMTALASGGDTVFGDARSVSSVLRAFETRITPAPLALWFWVPIHALGCAFVAYQAVVTPRPKLARLISRIDPFYATAQILTTTWLLTFIWGTGPALWAGTGVLALLVVCMLTICVRARLGQTTRASLLEYVVIDCYFSLWCGWVTVFFVVNLATALYASGWRGEPWTEDGWACAVISLAAAVSLLVLRHRADVFGSLFSSVFSWTSLTIGIGRRDTPEEQLVAAVAFSLGAVVGVVALTELLLQGKPTIATWRSICSKFALTELEATCVRVATNCIVALRPYWLRSGRLGPTWVSSSGDASSVPPVQEQLSMSLLEENARLRRQIHALQLSQSEASPKQVESTIMRVEDARQPAVFASSVDTTLDTS